jgi:hypothetical protein
VHHLAKDPASTDGKKGLLSDFARYSEYFTLMEEYFDLRGVN